MPRVILLLPTHRNIFHSKDGPYGKCRYIKVGPNQYRPSAEKSTRGERMKNRMIPLTGIELIHFNVTYLKIKAAVK